MDSLIVGGGEGEKAAGLMTGPAGAGGRAALVWSPVAGRTQRRRQDAGATTDASQYVGMYT
jgi:hypothetical protein